MKIQMRGRWGCGCSMAACELHQRQVATRAGNTVLTLSCRTHIIVVNGMVGLDAPTLDALDVEVTRRMNLLHEESCR